MFALMFLVALSNPSPKWKCSDWRPLQTDTVQQVKICEYRK